MASSASRQDEPNRALWLATRAGKMASGLPAVSREQNFPKSHIINPLLTKFVRSRWLDIGLVLFCEFMDLDFVSVHKHAKKELSQYPAILTSHLVNNPYILESRWSSQGGGVHNPCTLPLNLPLIHKHLQCSFTEIMLQEFSFPPRSVHLTINFWLVNPLL